MKGFISDRTVEESLDPKFFSNNYWTHNELFSADEVLKEFDL